MLAVLPCSGVHFLAHEQATGYHKQPVPIHGEGLYPTLGGEKPAARTHKISNGALGSPFDPAGFPPGDPAGHPFPPTRPARESTRATVGAVGNRRGSTSGVAPANTTSNPGIGGSAGLRSNNSSSTALAAHPQTRATAIAKRGPPISSKNPHNAIIAAASGGGPGRTRKVSDASDRSIKKDDLLERLADALK